MTDLDALTAFAVAELDETLKKWLERASKLPAKELARPDAFAPLVAWLRGPAIADVATLRRDVIAEMAETMTLREVGLALGISAQRVHQIIHQVI